MVRLLNITNNIKPLTEPSRKIENIPINRIKPNPYQPRKDFDLRSLEELAQSIREYGVIQPITVRKSNDNTYELIAGERRLRASKIAGLDYIPALILNSVEQDSAMIAMIENLQRENLHFLEEAKGYESLINDHNLTQEQLAKKIGKSQSTIANKLRILRLSEELKEIILNNNLTERHARALLKLPDNETRLSAIKEIVDKHLNVKDSEYLIEQCIRKIENKSNKKEDSKTRNQKLIFKRNKDIRIFVNTIRNAVKMIKNYGLNAQYVQKDKDDKIEITVIIPKM